MREGRGGAALRHDDPREVREVADADSGRRMGRDDLERGGELPLRAARRAGACEGQARAALPRARIRRVGRSARRLVPLLRGRGGGGSPRRHKRDRAGAHDVQPVDLRAPQPLGGARGDDGPPVVASDVPRAELLLLRRLRGVRRRDADDKLWMDPRRARVRACDLPRRAQALEEPEVGRHARRALPLARALRAAPPRAAPPRRQELDAEPPRAHSDTGGPSAPLLGCARGVGRERFHNRRVRRAVGVLRRVARGGACAVAAQADEGAGPEADRPRRIRRGRVRGAQGLR